MSNRVEGAEMRKWWLCALIVPAAVLLYASSAWATASATLTRDPSDSTGQTLRVDVTNNGPGDVTDLQFLLKDNAEHAADQYTISLVTPAGTCSPLNFSAQPHGVICSWNAGEFPSGSTKTISFRTNPRYPDNAGGSMSVNNGAAQDVPGPTANQPPSASFTAQPSPTDPMRIFVDGTGSHDPDGTVETYSWDFGDGGKGSGPQTAHSYAQPGTYTITLTVTDDKGATATTTRSVTINPSAGGGGTTTPPRFDDTEKKAFTALSALLGGTAVGCGVTSGVLIATGAGAPVALLTLALGAGTSALSGAFAALATDPPDPNFQTVAQPITPRVPKAKAGHGLTAAAAKAANALLANTARATGLIDATLTAINRASGANAAGNGAAVTMQDHAAATFADQAADRLNANSGLRAKLLKALKAGHFKSITVSAKQAKAFIASVRKHGLPAKLKKAAKRAGATPAEIAQVTSAIASARPKAVKFPGVLTSKALTTQETRAAESLRKFAKQFGG